MTIELRRYCERRKKALMDEREPMLSAWRQVSEYVDPTRGRFSPGESRKSAARRSRNKIINNKTTQVLRVMSAGMMSHMTSKARPWFRLTPPDPGMTEMHDVRVWLDDAAQRVRDALAKSNFYKAMPVLYTEDGLYGVAPLLALEDSVDVARFYVPTVGSYAIGTDDQQRVDCMWRWFQRSAKQLADRYGEDNLPTSARSVLKSAPDTLFTVESLLEKNPDARPGMGPLGVQAPKYRPYREVLWIEGSATDQHGVLSIGGHYEAPFVAARWNPVGDDIYSSSPALDSLGDIKQLQYLEGEKLRLLDLIGQPPTGLPESLRGHGATLNAGAKLYLPDSQIGAKAEVIYSPHYGALQAVREEIRVVEGRIEQAFFYNLFLMLEQLGDQTGRTATEIAERREEKSAVLGPTLESLTDEVLDPVVVRVYRLLERAGQIPDAPEALNNVPLKIEYTSILAQAQKANGTGTIERTVQFIGGLAQLVGPQVLDKLDADQTVDEYHNSLGAPATMVRSEEAVTGMREQREQQQRMAQMAQMAPALKQGAEAVKTAGEAVPEDGSMAQAMIDAMGGGQ